MIVMYDEFLVEELLRNYYSLSDMDFSDMRMDVEAGLKALKKYNTTLFDTIFNVLINSMPIQQVAVMHDVSTRQVNRRVHDALYALTIIMNGELPNEAS
jgi:hypothetical protein